MLCKKGYEEILHRRSKAEGNSRNIALNDSIRKINWDSLLLPLRNGFGSLDWEHIQSMRTGNLK